MRVKGVWETSEARGRRLALMPDGVIVLRDGRAENAWENASMWQRGARVREMPADAEEGTADLVEGADRRRASPADARAVLGPRGVARHSASSRWETRRVARAEARRRGARDAACPEGDDARGPSTAGERNLEPRVGRGPSRHNAVFAAWLVDTFGVEALRGGEKDEKDEKDTNDENDENAAASAHAIGPASGGERGHRRRSRSPAELALEHGVPVTLVDRQAPAFEQEDAATRAQVATGNLRRNGSAWRRRICRACACATSAPRSRECAQSESRTFGETAASVQDFERDVADVADVAEVTDVAENTKANNRRRRSRGVRARRDAPRPGDGLVFETALALAQAAAVVPCCVFAATRTASWRAARRCARMTRCSSITKPRRRTCAERVWRSKGDARCCTRLRRDGSA